MKTKKILSALMLILFALFVVQCEKQNGRPDHAGEGDEDSDRPEWAGGGDGDNPHQNPNPSPGISKGGDYGDLYELLRTVDGMPIMTAKTVEGVTTYYVQPVDAQGEALTLNDEGELVNPELALSVEFGRLNIVRSPPSVLEQAFNESLKVLKDGEVEGRVVIGITLDFCGRLTSEYSDDGGITTVFKTIDSPRENMAIYKEIMQNQKTSEHVFTGRLEFLNDRGIGDPLEIAASCFAAGSDKTGIVNEDEMIYINTFMECVGDVPLLNDNEFGPDGLEREYFDFTSYNFTYDRSVYGNRYIQYLVDENGIYQAPDPVTGLSTSEEIYTILAVFEGDKIPVYGSGEFTARWDEAENAPGAELFALAIDDAVQVLDYVHGDSNIRFVDEDGNPL